MSWMRFFRRAQWDAERARELYAYLQIETDENIGRGMTPEAARRAAYRKLGNPVVIREDIYRLNTPGWLAALWQDAKYGARVLRLNPGFAIVAILSLALGVGANSAIFQLIDAIRLRTLPVERPQELVEVRVADQRMKSGSFNGRRSNLTNALFEQIRARQQAFSGIFAFGSDAFDLNTGGEVRLAQAMWVSGDFFRVLAVRPLLGRLITADDDRRGCAVAGVISYGFWQRQFGGDPSAVGRKLILAGHPFEIRGVTPANFFGVEVGSTFDVAVPLCAEPIIEGENSQLDKPDHWWLAAIGRLKPGWSVERASAHLKSLSPELFDETTPPTFTAHAAKTYRDYRLGAFAAGSGVSALRQNVEQPLWLLLAVTGLVLLIACANLANLMLARASAREREIAIRLAVGASRARLIRQLLEESLLLAVTGAALGAGLAQLLSRALMSFLSRQQNALFVDLRPDWRLVTFTGALAMLTCILFGLAPALRAAGADPGTVLKAGARGLTASRERFGLRRLLVVAQVALSLVLLVGALLFVRSLRNELTLDAGFQQDGILITDVDATRVNVPIERRNDFKRDLVDRIRAIHGVDAAADTNTVPVAGDQRIRNVVLGGQEKGPTAYADVGPGYLRTIGTVLLAGRDFDERDTANSGNVAIVNETFARRYFAAQNPIGRTFRLNRRPGQPDLQYEVVGLMRDAKYADLREDFQPVTFFPIAQNPRPNLSDGILIRSNLPLARLTSEVKRAIALVHPSISIRFRVFKTAIQNSLLRERVMATLCGFFGVLAALLATVGLYGVIAYMVTKRKNEIGIRMALGATRGGVLRLILREAVALLAIGLLIGTLLATLAARAAASLLFGVRPGDPASIALAAGALAAAALAASYVPAWRASRVDPMVALRDE